MDDALRGLFSQITESAKAKKERKQDEKQTADISDTGFDTTQESKPRVCKSPNASTFFQVAQASYQKPKERPQIINQWWVKVQGFQTPTFTAYEDRQNDVFLIGYRGTVVQSVTDLTADKRIMFNRLSDSDRYKKDLRTTSNFLERFGRDKCIFTVGHSLGGAIQLQIQRDLDHFAKGGRGFNSALQPKDLVRRPKGYEFWFIAGDPLYSLSGRFLKKNLFVFPQVAKKPLQNHSLENFKGLKKNDAINKKRGGGRRKPDLNDLVKLGLISKSDKQQINHDPWKLVEIFKQQ
eukprot:gb/GECG01000711.1/.p1 GENE.gb/GECG01000711.1/~~gb/GECG01000711.1/.p1  ORF type:complete len:292 (+),score=34.04 gb/GECG01000711.1/:1-876(+)